MDYVIDSKAYKNALNQAQANVSPDRPRELGYIERVEGLKVGLETLSDQLAAFACRVNGVPMGSNASTPSGSGLPSAVNDAEASLRRCFEILREIDRAF